MPVARTAAAAVEEHEHEQLAGEHSTLRGCGGPVAAQQHEDARDGGGQQRAGSAQADQLPAEGVGVV